MPVASLGGKMEHQKAVAGFVMDDIPIVRKITRLLENGAECRQALDAVIDHCAAMQNLRQAVLHYRRAFNQQNLEHHARRAALNRGIEYLERYMMLIAFAAYLGSDAFDGYCQVGSSGTPFKIWLHRRPEVRQMKWSMRLRPIRVFTINVSHIFLCGVLGDNVDIVHGLHLDDVLMYLVLLSHVPGLWRFTFSSVV
jgi:hypothetical protein